MTNKSFPVVMYAAGAACSLLSLTIVPWAHRGGGVLLRYFSGWEGLPIGMLALCGSVAVVLFTKYQTSRIAMIAVGLSAVFTIAYASVLISRYDERDGITHMVVGFPGLGGPLTILAVILGTFAAFSSYRRTLANQAGADR